VNFGPLTPEITRLMFTHPKSIVRVLRMLMHLCAGHVTLLPGEFHFSKFLPQSDLGRRADSRWALPQISSSVSTEQHVDIKSGVSQWKNATILQAWCASALSCSNMWNSNNPHRHVNAIALHVFCGCNCKTSKICHQRTRFFTIGAA